MSLWVCSKWNEQPTDEEKIEVKQYGEVYQSIDLYGPERWVIFLPISHYRPCDPPAPPERWVDVTSDCYYLHDEIGKHPMFHNGKVASRPDYRLRKVRLYRERGPIINGDLSDDDYIEQWAFIVEKNEST